MPCLGFLIHQTREDISLPLSKVLLKIDPGFRTRESGSRIYRHTSSPRRHKAVEECALDMHGVMVRLGF